MAPADAGPPRPRFHLDMASVEDGRCFVVGWAVRKPRQDPEVFLLRDGQFVAPLVTFPRPDVIEYFTYERTPDVGRADHAYGFVFATPADGFDTLQFGVQGLVEPLREFRRGPQDDLSFLKRYLEALRPLPHAPSADAARTWFIRLLTAGGLADAAREAAGDRFDADRMSADTLLAGCRTHGPAFRKGATLGRRVALLAIHQRHAHLTHSHRAMLAALRARGYRTVLINSRQDSPAGQDAVEQRLCAGLITRADHGRDFASWLLAAALLGARLGQVEETLFCNDSFVGPFDDLASMLADPSREGADFWALTDSWERGYHLQSSFFTLSARTLASPAWRHFADGYGYPNERDAVVREGELGLSRALLDDGELSFGVLAPYARLAADALAGAEATLQAIRALPGHTPPQAEEKQATAREGEAFREGFLANPEGWTLKLLADLRRGLPRNPQHVFWEPMLRVHRIPFVKKELLLSNPAGVPDYFRILPTIGEMFGAEHEAAAEADMRPGAVRAPVR